MIPRDSSKFLKVPRSSSRFLSLPSYKSFLRACMQLPKLAKRLHTVPSSYITYCLSSSQEFRSAFCRGSYPRWPSSSASSVPGDRPQSGRENLIFQIGCWCFNYSFITLFSFEQKQQNRKTGWGFPFNYRLGKLILEISILVASVLTKYLQLGRWTLTTCPSIIIIICRIIRKYPNKYCVILKSLKSQVFKLGLTFNIYLLSKIRDKFKFLFDVGWVEDWRVLLGIYLYSGL